MPLYEYQCAKDGVFELVRKFSDPPLTQCPTCGGAIEKLASAPAIQFKGTGWYVTDYARKSGGGGDEAKASSKESGDAAKSSSTESKDKSSSSTPSTPSTPSSTSSETKSAKKPDKPDKK